MELHYRKIPPKYFFGGGNNKGKSSRRGKPSKEKKTLPLESTPTPCNEDWVSISVGGIKEETKVNVMEEKLVFKSIQVKLKTYERIKEADEQCNYRKQRLAEKKYLEEQESLVQTWLEGKKGHHQVKDINSGIQRFLPCYISEITVPIKSRKSLNTGKEKKQSPRVEEDKVESTSCRHQSTPDDLEEDFTSKLVFVDTEGSEEDDCKLLSRRYGCNSLRKSYLEKHF